MDEFEAAVNRTLAAHRLLAPRDRIVLAVSGGADSVALLGAMTTLAPAWKLSLSVAYLDHGLRPESAADAEFVSRLAGKRGVPAVIERQDVQRRCEREGWSLEDGARRIRYEFLLRTAAAQGAHTVALAHTADDQAETVLMRLLRGTGLMGLRAIGPKRTLEGCSLIRPLLSLWRKDVLGYVARRGLSFREDASNADLRFTRNRIRHELLPLLERDYNPNVKAAMVQLAEQSGTDYAFLEAAAGRQWKRAVKPAQGRSGDLTIAISAFLGQPPALQRQLLRRAIGSVKGEPGQLEYRHWLETERLFRERPVGTLLDLPGGVRLRREQRTVILARRGALEVE
jgi:tRNA(Ile)-lysidine synthase